MTASGARRALIVGGGIGGMCCGLRLRAVGFEADLIDKDPGWRVYGAGITITGPTLRAFKQLGLLEDVKATGFCSGDAKVFTPAAEPVGVVHIPQLALDIPPTGGIMRPALHHLLSTRTRAVGVRVRLGLTVDRLDDDPNRPVQVRFSDGSSDGYDLVVGADGIYSQVRKLLFPDAPKPRFTGQGSWRVVAPRPPEVTSTEFYFGGPHKVGLNPCSSTQLYMFLLNHVRGDPYVAPDDQLPTLREMLSGYGGRIASIRSALGPQSSIVYRPLEDGGPGRWDEIREEMGDRSLRHYQKFVQNLTAENIVKRTVVTPLDHARNMPTSMPGGDVHGVAPYFYQTSGHRPTPDLAQYTVPGVERLYLVGPFMHPGGGVYGAGRATAMRMFEDLKLDFDKVAAARA
jgi:2-polyprenyl-6-methoxyphenol hydroxylase-like FAD-dependent oxidoreductase